MSVTLKQLAEMARSAYNDPYEKPFGKYSCQRFEWAGRWEKGGFQAAAFRHEDTNNVIISFAGTRSHVSVFGAPIPTLSDLDDDLKIALSKKPPQVKEAKKFFQTYGNGVEKTACIGHSLGGALAQWMGHETKCPFVTFNAPGIGKALLAGPQKSLAKKLFKKLTKKLKKDKHGFQALEEDAESPTAMNYFVENDKIGTFGTHFGDEENLGRAPSKAHAIKTVIELIQRTGRNDEEPLHGF